MTAAYSPVNKFDGAYTMYPDNAVAVDISSADHVFSDAVTIYVGGAGNVIVKPFGIPTSSGVTFNIPAGGVVPCRVGTVIKTNTTATSMVAVY